MIYGSLLGLAFIMVAVYLPSVWIWPILLVVATLAQLEFYAMVNMSGIPAFRILGVACGVALISVTFYGITIPGAVENLYFWEQFVLLCSLIAVFIRQFPQKNNPRPLETIACTVFGVCYVPFLLNFFTRLMFEWDCGAAEEHLGPTGRTLLLYAVVVVKMTDVGALFIGRAIGRHKLFPRLSPGKTWEGLVGGLIITTITSLCFWYFGGGTLGRIPFTVTDAVLLAILLGLSGVIGDLFESLLKRAAGLKDSSHVVPGIGGILDVLDSLLFGAPVLYLYLRFFVV